MYWKAKEIFIKYKKVRYMTRLNKYLAECGICSRREADKLIEQGRVKLNGKAAVSGMQVQAGDCVELNGKRVLPLNSKVVLAYNKPVGITCTEKDKHAEKTITDAIKYPIRLTYAGRLDKESDGLIIMTNDGELIQQMMKGINHHEKEYIVKVNKDITEEFIFNMARYNGKKWKKSVVHNHRRTGGRRQKHLF